MLDINDRVPAYSYGTTDLTAGTSKLETGKLHFVYSPYCRATGGAGGTGGATKGNYGDGGDGADADNYKGETGALGVGWGIIITKL